MTRRNNNLPNTDTAPAAHSSNVSRRDALQTVAKTVAAGAVGLASIGNAMAAIDGPKSVSELPPIDKRHWVSGHDGVLVFVDDWEGVSNQQMRAVSFMNTSDYPITLEHVNPGLLRADNQVFNLNHILAKSPLTLMPQEPVSFGLYPVEVDNIEQLIPGELDTVGTLIRCTPHTIAVEGRRTMTQYAVIA